MMKYDKLVVYIRLNNEVIEYIYKNYLGYIRKCIRNELNI